MRQSASGNFGTVMGMTQTRYHRVRGSSVNVVHGGNYSMTLPVGFYDLVASSFGKTTVVNEDVEV
jgi:hypothetical protein